MLHQVKLSLLMFITTGAIYANSKSMSIEIEIGMYYVTATLIRKFLNF